MVLLQGPRRRQFLMSWVTLYLGGDEREGRGVIVDAHHLEYLADVARRLQKGS